MMLDINGLPKNANGIRTTHTCELCGFEPKTKNKYREKQDHLVMKHFKDRIDKIFPHCRPYKCPNPDCDFTGKDKQALLRHYTGKHGVLELYLREALAEKGIQYNISETAKRKTMNQRSESDRKAKEARLSPPTARLSPPATLTTQITNIQVSPITNINSTYHQTTNLAPPTVLTTTGNTTYPTINVVTQPQQLSHSQNYQTMVADTTTPFNGSGEYSMIIQRKTVPTILQTTTKIPQMTLSSPNNIQQTTNIKYQTQPTITNVSLGSTAAKLPTLTPAPHVNTQRLPSMSTVLSTTSSRAMNSFSYGKCDVDALLASFQPIDTQLIVNLPHSPQDPSDLPLDSPLVSSTTQDFCILPDDDLPTKLVLNDNIMWGSGNLPIVSEPAQTVPVNYLDAGNDIGFDDIDYEYLTSNAVMTGEGTAILASGDSRQLSFSML